MKVPGDLQQLWWGTQADMYSNGVLIQPGGWSLPELFDLPLAVPGDPVDPGWQAEAQIETFIVDPHIETCEPTGSGPAVRWWQPAVERFVGSVHGALRAAGVELKGPATVTASVTATTEVNAEPHMDDAQYSPADGVGIVAVAASGAGPRALVGAITSSPRLGPLEPGVTELDPEVVGAFAGFEPNLGAKHRLEHYLANRITLFTRFGQVHSGPSPLTLTNDGVHAFRSLLVYRCSTQPQNLGPRS